jgi:glycosyltransferase involved in cell wall biosynthesis
MNRCDGAKAGKQLVPTVSVIVPNYNHAQYLRQRIESVLGQTYQDFEVILLDDCSTDESRSIIAEYENDPRVRIEFNEKNSGSTFKQWNRGVRMAHGKYVWIAESDDYADERLLERLVGVLEAEPDIAFVYCRSWRIAPDGEPNGYADWYLANLDPPGRWAADFRAEGREECRDYFVHANSVPNASAVVFRKALYDRLGGADERLRVCGDWKLWVLMAFEGKIAYLSEPLNYYREHDGSVRTQVQKRGLGAEEHLAMVPWLLERVTPTEATLGMAYSSASYSWIAAVLNWRVPLRRRWAILKSAMAIDPHALRRLIRRPWVVKVQLKLAREFRRARKLVQGRAS